MPNVRIKQLGERIATQGVHFGMGLETRKLEPGEVVNIEDEELFEKIYATDTIEITTENITRPLTYESVAEAKYCSPTFKPLDPSEKSACLQARSNVADRLAYNDKMRKQTQAGLKAANEAHKELRKRKADRASTREERMKKLKELQDGEENTT